MYTAGCGKGIIFFDESELPEQPPLDNSFQIKKQIILRLMKWFQASSGLHQRIRGAHSAALSIAGEMPGSGYDDVGRHNAVDKAIGRALLDDLDFSKCLLLASGRVSTEITHKAIKAGIPVVLSAGTPTHHALLLARTMNITLIGSAKAGSFSIYASKERIEL